MVQKSVEKLDISLKLLLPSSWIPELDKLSHAAGMSRLAYIRSRLRAAMDKDLEILAPQIEANDRFKGSSNDGWLASKFRKLRG